MKDSAAPSLSVGTRQLQVTVIILGFYTKKEIAVFADSRYTVLVLVRLDWYKTVRWVPFQHLETLTLAQALCLPGVSFVDTRVYH